MECQYFLFQELDHLHIRNTIDLWIQPCLFSQVSLGFFLFFLNHFLINVQIQLSPFSQHHLYDFFNALPVWNNFFENFRICVHQGYYLKKNETIIQKNIHTPMFIAALFTIAKIWNQPKCPSVDEWMKTM